MLSHCIVRWNDGSHDNQRTCDDCGLDNCATPVYKDYYREVVTKVSYWQWAESQTVQSDSGEVHLNGQGAGIQDIWEHAEANPDILEGKDDDA